MSTPDGTIAASTHSAAFPPLYDDLNQAGSEALLGPTGIHSSLRARWITAEEASMSNACARRYSNASLYRSSSSSFSRKREPVWKSTYTTSRPGSAPPMMTKLPRAAAWGSFGEGQDLERYVRRLVGFEQ